MASGVNYSTQQYFGFDPRTIPGCALWLDAADINTFTPANPTNGTAISQWNDKSGNNRHATQATAGNRPVYSSSDPSVDTTTSPRFFNMTSMPTAPYDIFVVARPVATTSDWRTLFRTATADPGMNPVVLEISSTRAGYWNSAAFQPFGSITWAANTRNLLFARMNASKTMNASLNGTVSLTADTAAGTASDVILYMGATVLSGSVIQQWGNINEVIFFTTPLTTFQRQQVEGYLAWKWGLQSNLPTNHPLKSNPTTMRIFQPIDISNCILWLDGADSSRVGVSGTNVTAWNDKSGLGNNLTTISATPPTYSSATGGITFTSQNFTSIRGPLNATYTNPISTFVVCSITSNVNAIYNPRLIVFGTNGTTATYLMGQLNIIGNASTGTTPAFISYAANSSNPTGQGINIQTYIPTTFSTTGIYENLSTYSGTALTNNAYLNGNTSTFSAISTTSPSPAPYVTSAAYVSIGNYTDGQVTFAGECFSGVIYEILVFSRTVTTSERQQIEGYLASKWRLSSLLPTSQPFYLQRALPSTPLFVPVNISGLQLWLDAADSSTITISSGVSQWNDKSGNGYNATQTTVGNRPTYDSTNNRINFARASAQFFNLPVNALPSGNSSYSYFVVLSFASLVDGLGIIGGGTYGTNYSVFALRSIGTAGGVHQYWWNADLQAASGVYSVNIPLLLQARYASGGTRATLKNGTQVVTDTPAVTRTQGTGNNRIGLTYTVDSEYMNGYINEIVVFSSDLPLSQRQQVEGYLAWKWGLQNNLPTTHPYYKFRP